MTQAQLNALNNLMDELHQDLADITDEIIDRDHNKALALINALIEKLKHLKQNLRIDDI